MSSIQTRQPVERARIARQDALRLGQNEFRESTDEEVHRWRRFYARGLLNRHLTADDRAYLTHQLSLCMAEERRRELAARQGVPRDPRRFPDVWIDNLKRQIDLPGLLEGELGAHLGKANAQGIRRGPCPVCRTSDRSTAFAVYTADWGHQFFRCYACGISGDCIAAIQIAYHESFTEAVKRLAVMGNVPLPAWGGAR